jgi:ring-1,2-phenylacetyl-CoA epoxidase subunit PaaE
MSSVILLYGSRSEDQIIFKDELERIANHYKNQFFVYHTLSKPDGKGLHIMKSLFGKKKKSDWKGWRGRISEAQVKELIEQHPPSKKGDLFFLCGPGDMIVLAEKTLRAQDIPEGSIKKEFFTSADPGSASPAKAKGQAAKVKVHMRGEEINIEVKDKTILDTLLDEGFDAPYSCHSGACATCMAKLISGKAEMDACFALSDQEVQNGYILACQARPLTETVELTFDE